MHFNQNMKCTSTNCNLMTENFLIISVLYKNKHIQIISIFSIMRNNAIKYNNTTTLSIKYLYYLRYLSTSTWHMIAITKGGVTKVYCTTATFYLWLGINMQMVLYVVKLLRRNRIPWIRYPCWKMQSSNAFGSTRNLILVFKQYIKF